MHIKVSQKESFLRVYTLRRMWDYKKVTVANVFNYLQMSLANSEEEKKLHMSCFMNKLVFPKGGTETNRRVLAVML